MRGDVAVQREVLGGYVWSAVPVVVALEGDLLGLWRPPGTVCLWPSNPRDEHPPFSQVTHRTEPWAVGVAAGILTLVPGDSDYSVSLMWHPDWSFWMWYVDFIRPYGNVNSIWPHCDGLKWPHPLARCSNSRRTATAVSDGLI